MKVKLMLAPLAVMALMAAVFAPSAMAQETIHFLSNGSPIGAGGVTVHYTGPASFENEAGGIACSETTAIVTFTTFDAHVTAFNAAGCKTTGLLPAFGCELTSETAPTSTNGGSMLSSTNAWTIEPLTTNTGQVSVDIDNPMKAGCFFGSNLEATGTVHITGVASNYNTATLSGFLTTAAGEVEVEGHLEKTPGEPTITSVST